MTSQLNEPLTLTKSGTFPG